MISFGEPPIGRAGAALPAIVGAIHRDDRVAGALAWDPSSPFTLETLVELGRRTPSAGRSARSEDMPYTVDSSCMGLGSSAMINSRNASLDES